MLVLRRLVAAGDKSILYILDPRLDAEVVVTVLATRGELVDLAVSVPAGVTVAAKNPVPSRRKPRPENKTAAP